MRETGDRPGKGVYECALCSTQLSLDNDSDLLPECPVCKCRRFYKKGEGGYIFP